MQVDSVVTAEALDEAYKAQHQPVEEAKQKDPKQQKHRQNKQWQQEQQQQKKQGVIAGAKGKHGALPGLQVCVFEYVHDVRLVHVSMTLV
jgi:hypothetical protein